MDAEPWKTIAQWAWVALAAPVALVWKRSMNAVQREDLQPLIDKISAMDKKMDHSAETLAGIEGYLKGRSEQDAVQRRH